MAFGGYALENAQRLARMYPGQGTNPADVYRGYSQERLKQQQQAWGQGFKEKQLAQSGELGRGSLAVQQGRLGIEEQRAELDRQKMEAYLAQLEQQKGMQMFQAGVPGYEQYLGGNPYQLQVPGGPLLTGQPAYQFGVNKYMQEQYGGGGGGTYGGGRINDLLSQIKQMEILRSGYSFSQPLSQGYQMYGELGDKIQKLMGQL